MREIKGKRITLGVTGCIAAYKAAEITRMLVKAGAVVKVIMTESATHFVGPLTLEKLSCNPVATDLFAGRSDTCISHISLAQEADAILIAPASANVLAKAAHGIADDLLTTTILASPGPVVFAPAMNTLMYKNPATQRNLSLLRERGCRIVEPVEGELACGDRGIGRLAETGLIVGSLADAIAASHDLEDMKVLVSAGGTQEPIDPIRYISNRSSGKMGFAIAEAALSRGALVTLVSAPAGLPVPPGCEFIPAPTASQMKDAILSRFEAVDAVIMAAAVSDYQAAEIPEQKMKKKDRMVLELVATPDILAELGQRKKDQLLVGFAAESESLVENARQKLKTKNLDIVVANSIHQKDAGIGKDDNQVTIIDGTGEVTELPTLPKRLVANEILNKVRLRLATKQNK